MSFKAPDSRSFLPTVVSANQWMRSPLIGPAARCLLKIQSVVSWRSSRGVPSGVAAPAYCGACEGGPRVGRLLGSSEGGRRRPEGEAGIPTPISL